ncbi:Protein transport protein SEC9 [Madurella mycetomatis]|uniref:Protein transport protein SEC9 n=1 Tax=Madurella mycetomatis TaxID=100816 RepID=A0A175W3K9_9PEZI|nr:Protein transport protein SEC9 [Madurella mycetomatis]
MGKFSSFLRKSSDKDKTDNPNPYAQQHESPRYDGNQYHGQNSQPYTGPPAGSGVGLPSSVRPGGLPNKLASGGVGRSAAFESDKASPPPAYNNDSSHLPGYSSQHASRDRSYNSASPSMGSGYARDKLGASDGIGRDRYGAPTSGPSSQPSQRPVQNQGGYGGLESDKGGLFANYNAPPKYTAGANFPQPGGPVDAQGRPLNWNEMTEEERENAQVQATKTQIEQTSEQTVDVSRNIVAMARNARMRTTDIRQQLARDGELLDHAESRMEDASAEADKGDVNLDDLTAANKSIFNPFANSKSRIAARNEKKMTIQQQREMRAEEAKREAYERQQAMATEMQKIRESRPKKLLGGNKNKDFGRWDLEFEDDSGRQREMNEEIDKNLDEVEQLLGEVHFDANAISLTIDKQNQQVSRMAEKTERANDRVRLNQMHLDTFNRR